MRRVSFQLTQTFVRGFCSINENGGKCPFLEIEGEKIKCINFTHEGVLLHKKIKKERIMLDNYCGCDYSLMKILKNKDFFIGKIVEYADGSNTEEVKKVFDIVCNRKKRTFTVLLKTDRDKIPFPFIVNFDYLSVYFLKNIVRFTNELGYGGSIDVFVKE